MTRELPPEAVAWVTATVGRGARLVAQRRLTGGLTAAMHAVTVADRSGLSHRFVVRRWTAEPQLLSLDQPASELVDREAAILAALEEADLPTPRLIATDPGGAASGCPSLVMSRLPGRMLLAPADRGWVRQLAETLVRLHALRPATRLAPYRSWLGVGEVPSWTRRPELWREAIALARTPAPRWRGGFVHHDYQPFNLLWSRSGRLSGIVDWTFASAGPPDEDVTHCRLNLVLLHSARLAEDFRRAYEAAGGRPLDPWWDVASLVDYLDGWSPAELQRQAGRRLRLDAAGAPLRVERLLALALRRAGV